MKKTQVKPMGKSVLIRKTEGLLAGTADIFVKPLCTGLLYEIKVPKKLVK